MRILIIGGMGMLGHKLCQVLGSSEEVIVAIRGSVANWPTSIPTADVIGNVDVRESAQLAQLLARSHPDAVLNAVGVIKQIIANNDPSDTVAVNALYPNLLARFCSDRGIRLIHYSTDCVFSGSESSERGLSGYREIDLPDARDLYGMTKLLGEPPAPTLVLRTSIIGRELKGHHGLVDWFLSQDAGPVKGFTQALFSGLPTIQLARITRMILHHHPGLQGLWHVAAAPIDKYALLGLLKINFHRATAIEPNADLYCDRRLDGSRFSHQTGWNAPDWPHLIDLLAQDGFDNELYA